MTEEVTEFTYISHPQRQSAAVAKAVEKVAAPAPVAPEPEPFLLGKFESGLPLKLNLDKLLETRLLIQAASGGGKSYLIRKILEETHGKVLQIVLDPEGEFANLTANYDYRVAGVWDFADVRPTAANAAELGLEALASGRSLLADLYELDQDERIAFVGNLLTALIDSPKHLWRPTLLVIDEAHIFAPDKVKKLASAKPMIELASRGRKRGFACIVATQRVAKLHKDIAAECLNKLIGRTTLEKDVQRSADEVGLRGARANAIRKLSPGQFFAYGPALSEYAQTVTIGKAQTEHGSRVDDVKRAQPPPLKALPGGGQQSDREQIWTECVSLARRLTKGLSTREQIAELAIRCCDIKWGGGGHWTGFEGQFTVKRFAEEIGIHYKTVWGWVRTKTQIVDKLEPGEYQPRHWRYAFQAMKSKPSDDPAGRLEAFRALRDAGPTEMYLQTVMKWTRAHLKFFRDADLSKFGRDDLAVVRDSMLEVGAIIDKHLARPVGRTGSGARAICAPARSGERHER